MARRIARASALSTTCAILLLLGTALLGAGAALHPVLPPTLEGQLAVIAQTSHWRTIHLLMLAGSGLVAIGLWGQLLLFDPRARRGAALMMAAVVAGLALNASNVAFMAQTGTADAGRYVHGNAAAAASFAAAHSASLGRARLGNAIVALASLVLAILLWRQHPRRRVLAALAAAAALGGLIGVGAFDPASREAVAAVALFSVWAAVAALRTLWDAGAPARGRLPSPAS